MPGISEDYSNILRIFAALLLRRSCVKQHSMVINM